MESNDPFLPSEDDNTPWQLAFNDEKLRIRRRRKIAFEIDNEPKPVNEEENLEVENLTGVSLSGGGIRSALFNDGLVQALSHRGLLRYVDYLSTVSGGGYLGGHLISCGVEKRNHPLGKDLDVDGSDDSPTEPKSNSAENANGGSAISEYRSKSFHADERFWKLGKCPNTGRVQSDRLPNVGGYLQKSSLFVAKYFTTQIFVFLVYLGLVGCVATMAALFWRSFDNEQFRQAWSLYGLNAWGGEISLAFYPTIWLVSIWVGASLIRACVSVVANFKNELKIRPALTYGYELFMKYLGFTILVSLLIAIAVLMGNGLTSSNPNMTLEEEVHLNRFAEILALIAGITQFLVFLGRNRLFKSEQSEAESWQRLAGKLMSIGVVALLFFSMTHMMARENISHYSDHRDAHLVRQDVLQWQVFESLLESSEKLINPNEIDIVDSTAKKEKSLRTGSRTKAPTEIEINSLVRQYERIKDKQSVISTIRQQYVSRSRWERFMPGEDLSNPPSPRDPSIENSRHHLNKSFLSRITNFFVVSSYKLIDSTTTAIDENEKLSLELREEQEQFLRTFNTVLDSPEFTRILLQEFNKERDISASLKDFVGSGKEATKLASQIATSLPRKAKAENNQVNESAIFKFLNDYFRSEDEEVNQEETNVRYEVIATMLSRYGIADSKVNATAQAIMDAIGKKKTSEITTADIEGVLIDNAFLQSEESFPTEIKIAFGAIDNPKSMVLLNRRLLDLLYPRDIKARNTLSTGIVHSHDQQARWGWLKAYFCLFLLGLLGTWNLNWQNSIFQFYRGSLETNFLHGWFDQSTSKKKSLPSKAPIMLSQCDVTDTGLPYPLMIGTWMQRHRKAGRPEYKPFLFSPNKLGIANRNKMIEQDPSWDVQSADQYQLIGMNRKIQLSDAVAISGSAVTPMMTNSVWLASMIDFFGVGLGQWMRKPNFKNPNQRVLSLGYLGQCIRYFLSRDSVGFVADGGYEDVLGAYELLRRQCELIIVSDACCNTNSDELGPLAKLLETANSNLGIQFFDLDHESPIDYGRLVKDENSNLPQNHLMMRIRYPEVQGKENKRDGLLIYLQMGITETDPIEIRQIKKKFPAFPDEPTSNQFYTHEQVTAYQKLGYYIGNKICSELVRWEPDDILRAENYRRLFTFQENVEKLGTKDDKIQSISKLLELSGDFYGQDLADESRVTTEAENLINELMDQTQDPDLEEADRFHAKFDPNQHKLSGEKDPANIEPISSKNQPLFDVLKNRLLTGYRLACYEEDNYSENDIFSEAVWDRNEWCFVSFKKCVENLKPMVNRISSDLGYETKLAAVNDLCVEWLRVYQTNSDVCAVYRNFVFLDINGRMLSTQSNESTSKAVLGFMIRTLGLKEATSEDQCAAMWAAHFAVTGIACQQFHRGIPRSIFQIGGREKLTDLATSLFFAKNHREKQVSPALPPTLGCISDGQPYSWWQWLEKKCGELAELKTGVFNSAFVESTVSFTQILILHLQTRQKNHSTKPINGVLIRKRIFDAVNNFGIGDVEKIKSLEQVVRELFHIKEEKKPAKKSRK